jgi:hypothetical protein
VPLLLARLVAHQHGGVIEDIDEEDIWYVNNRGQSKRAPVSGLKDRLTRARKFLRSQKPV